MEVFIIEIKMRRRMILMKTKTSFTNLTPPSQEIEQPCRWTEERGRTRWQSSSPSLCLLSIFHLRRRIIIIIIIIIIIRRRIIIIGGARSGWEKCLQSKSH